MFNLYESILPIGFLAMIVLVVYYTTKFSYKTKKAILDKGGNIEVTKKRFPLIEIGLTILGLGVGLAISVIPQSLNISEDSKDLLIGACILLFGGFGLVSAYFIRRKVEKK